MRNIFVLGGSGFTGRRVVALLVSKGLEVKCLVRSDAARRTVIGLGAEAVDGNLDSEESLRKAFAEADSEVLVSVASLGFEHGPSIVAEAERASISRAVFVSTTGIYTKLDVPSKPIRLRAEVSIKNSSIPSTIVRPTMIYGSIGDRNMERLINFVKRCPVVPLPGSGFGMQQPIFVDDLASVIVECVFNDEAINKQYNVAGSDPISFRDIVCIVGSEMGRRVIVLPVPKVISYGLTRATDRLFGAFPISSEQVLRLSEDKIVDYSSAASDLGFAPRTFEKGIAAEIREIDAKLG